MTRSEILDKAKECVCGQREQDYGKPEDNFATIADLWSTYKGTEFNAKDVAVMMSLMKIARIKTGTSTDDCFVDLAGYAACGGEIASFDKTETGASQLGGVVIGQARHPKRQLTVSVNTMYEFDRIRESIRKILDKEGRLTVYDVRRLLKRWGTNGCCIGYLDASMKDFLAYGWKKDTIIDYDTDRMGKYCIILPYPIKLDSNKEDI